MSSVKSFLGAYFRDVCLEYSNLSLLMLAGKRTEKKKILNVSLPEDRLV